MLAPQELPVLVIGAGPAGLTCAFELLRRGVPVVVVDADCRVGGLAQTAEYKGFRFDIGGHRFFTKVPMVADLWRSILGPEFIRRPRLSRIYYNGKFFDYPLKAINALTNLGLLNSIAIVASYLWIRLRPIRPEVSFEDWVSNRFGRRLYKTFFETYTEKVWGIPCRTISAQWAAQRIKGLSLTSAVIKALFPWWYRQPGRTIKTLIDEFEYPRLGPGMMWEAFHREIERLGGRVQLNTRVTRILHEGSRVRAVEIEQDGQRRELQAAHVVSTMPLRQLISSLDPAVPSDVRVSADRLKYRDFITVALIVDDPDIFPDNWIYVHDETVKVGRIQNFKNWSPSMVPDESKTCLGLEYFCTVGDPLWSLTDAELVALGRKELVAIGLARAEAILDGTVVRMPKAYPVYDDGFMEAVDATRRYLDIFSNLQPIGRNGTHKYNNQDHSMVMAMLAARNFFGERHDLWAINADDEYQEEVQEGAQKPVSPLERDLRNLSATQPLVPERINVSPAYPGGGA